MNRVSTTNHPLIIIFSLRLKFNMKLIFTIIFAIIVIGQSNVLNPMKIPSSVRGSVLSAAGKFLSGKNNKAVASIASVPSNPQGSGEKSSRMGKLLDLGTNAAMALAGAGTLFQALSSDPASAPAPVSHPVSL